MNKVPASLTCKWNISAKHNFCFIDSNFVCVSLKILHIEKIVTEYYGLFNNVNCTLAWLTLAKQTLLKNQ